jgi:hypothetical protein
MVRRMGLFAYTKVMDPEVPFLGRVPTGEADELRVDNPDGCVTANGIEGGPYGVGPDRGREYSQGMGTPKGNLGNASGRGQTMTLLRPRAGRRGM